MNPVLRKKIVEELVKEIAASSYRAGDAEWYIGFKPSAQTPVEEMEYDPRTGEVVSDTRIGDRATYLQQWDDAGSFFLEDDDIPDRDSGTYSFRLQNL
jgi:hypothetical protein